MNSLNLPSRTPTNWKGDFTFHALDLNAGMVEAVDAENSREAAAQLDLEISSHWIFASPTYAPRLQELVSEARAVHAWANVVDVSTDQQVAARLLKAFGLWSHPEPSGVWGGAQFFARFLAAYGRFLFKVDYTKGRMRHPGLDHAKTQLS